MLLKCCQGIEIHDSSRDSHERGVEAVEHASMTWQDMTRVLDAEGTLEERFHQVSPGTEDDDYEAETDGEMRGKSLCLPNREPQM